MRSMANIHPRVWFLYLCVILGITMFLWHPGVAAVSLLGACLWRHRLQLSTKPAQLLGGLFFVLLLTGINPLISHEGVTVLFYLQGRPITLEALIYGALAAVMLESTLLWCSVFSNIMTSDRLLAVFGGRFPRIGMVFTLVLRFVPLFLRQWRRIREGQQALYGTAQSYRERFAGWKREMVVMLTWCLEHGLTTADAMAVRGYGNGSRSFYERYRFGRREAVCLAVILLLTDGLLVLWGQGYLRFECYPQIQGSWGQPMDFFALVLWSVLLFAPVVPKWRKKYF